MLNLDYLLYYNIIHIFFLRGGIIEIFRRLAEKRIKEIARGDRFEQIADLGVGDDEFRLHDFIAFLQKRIDLPHIRIHMAFSFLCAKFISFSTRVSL